jgi:acyl-[acyl carrier protein]--UDP-N-acetylglucosamine O-acyltransferase
VHIGIQQFTKFGKVPMTGVVTAVAIDIIRYALGWRLMFEFGWHDKKGNSS